NWPNSGNPSQPAVDQNGYSVPQYSNTMPPTAPQIARQQAPAPLPMPTPQPQPSPVPPSAPPSNPTAPSIPTPLRAGSPAPLAAGFVNRVNEKFDGDISHALFNPETRAWAKMLGLVDGDTIFMADLSPDRVETIKRIFKDASLDPASKLNAVKILLHSSMP